jgi:magnesium transporter
MIKTMAVTHDHRIEVNLQVSELFNGNFLWYWIDFQEPSESEIQLLSDSLEFHPLAIEDCVFTLQRPKLDYYDEYTFFVTQTINPVSITKDEINFFLAKNFIVTFHHQPSQEIKEVWERLSGSKSIKKWNPTQVLYHALDKMVDNYFPLVYQIEDTLNEIDENSKGVSMEVLLEKLFDTRHDLLTLRHTITPMRDLVYRIINSQRLTDMKVKVEYFSDIHDHLLKLSELIEANRELTMDIRDSYISLNSHQTNRVMKVLTVITTIFMPLTFIAGIYGMNFQYIPELSWKYGYFITLFLMFLVGFGMSLWFKRKGWFK